MAQTQLQIEDALEDIRDALRVDGYDLGVVAASADELRLRLDALENACKDCLVPATAMAMMVSAKLEAYSTDQIHIAYPS